jgi:hypothetical protein
MNDEVMNPDFPLMRIFEATLRPSRLADDFETVGGACHLFMLRAPLMPLAGRLPRPLCAPVHAVAAAKSDAE